MRHKRKESTFGAERCRPLTHAIRVSVRLASSLHAFSRSLARHFSSHYLCTVPICRHYYIDLPPNYRHLPPNLCQFGGKLPPFPHGTHTVPARCLRRTRTTSSPYPHDAPALIPQTEQPFLPCRRQATTRVSRPCSRIFTCGEMGIATSHIICRGMTISMPEEFLWGQSPHVYARRHCGDAASQLLELHRQLLFFLVNLMSALFQVFHVAGRQSGMKKRSRLVPFFGSFS